MSTANHVWTSRQYSQQVKRIYVDSRKQDLYRSHTNARQSLGRVLQDLYDPHGQI